MKARFFVLCQYNLLKIPSHCGLYQWKLELKVAASNHVMNIQPDHPQPGSNIHAHNPGFTIYFTVGDIHSIVIEGLQGKTYIDKTRHGQEFVQQGDLILKEETDRIYLHANAAQLIDPVYNREVSIESEGGNALVVWNPGKKSVKTIADLEAFRLWPLCMH